MSQKKKAKKQAAVIQKHNATTAGEKYLLFLFLIVAISFFVYLPVLQNGFINLDDDRYIQNNPMLTSIDLSEIFSRYVEGNYHPLTMLCYAIEWRLFGLNPSGYHAVNLLLHLLNVILVFYIVFNLSNRKEPALIAALLFGIHPLHVESVAWASELKDLLYSFFFLASWLCYLRYLKQPQKKWFWYCLLLFLLSLLSKAMAVSLPVVLLLTDYFKERKMNGKLWLEKIPFFILSVIFGIIAILAQKTGGAIQDLQFFSFFQRIVFACYGFIIYLVKFLFPYQLSAYYPYPVKTGTGIPGWFYIFPVMVLAVIAFIFFSLRSTKKIFFGFAFFVVTIFLVLQLLPVGNTIMADRYSYIPSIGIFFLIGEGVYRLWSKTFSPNNFKNIIRFSVAGLMLAAVIIFSVSTYKRCLVWENSLSFWNDVIKKYQTIPVAYNNRAMALEKENKIDSALYDYNRAIELQPDFAMAHNNRGNIWMNRGFYGEAMNDYSIAITLQPNFAQPYNGKGVLLMREKKFDSAIINYQKAIALKPGYVEVYYNMAISEYNLGRKNEACGHLQKAMSMGMQQAADLYKQICH